MGLGRTEKRCINARLEPALDCIEITTSVLVVHVSFLDLLGKLPLPLTRLLGTLQLQAVLVHRETHCLEGK